MKKTMRTNSSRIALAAVAGLCLYTGPSYAWKLGEPLDKFVKDTGGNVEQVFQGGGKALAEVVTFGEDGRRKDHDRAEGDKARALETKRIQEEKVKAQVLEIEKLVAKSQSHAELIQQYIVSAKMVVKMMDACILSSQTLIRAILQGRIDLSIASEIFHAQADLMRAGIATSAVAAEPREKPSVLSQDYQSSMKLVESVFLKIMANPQQLTQADFEVILAQNNMAKLKLEQFIERLKLDLQQVREECSRLDSEKQNELKNLKERKLK